VKDSDLARPTNLVHGIFGNHGRQDKTNRAMLESNTQLSQQPFQYQATCPEYVAEDATDLIHFHLKYTKMPKSR
jgi:hypothetical protein